MATVVIPYNTVIPFGIILVAFVLEIKLYSPGKIRLVSLVHCFYIYALRLKGIQNKFRTKILTH